ncbi:GtrA family protein [Mesorhizobium sp. AR07]|uniref:GtrA family protein n=1 Tax=Mesorhizobium sp. AR07 TaxID=2865838 RepID=UPI002160FE66|nr:GtrA family protein [Mesorhizobium sp. AR07]UVK46799.1 GtrA family protein [Mesorhizobium sp. AR07]
MVSGVRLGQIAVFIAVGLFNTGAYFLIANGLHLIVGLTETFSAFAAYVALVPLSFVGHRKLTFASNGLVVGELAKFCVVQATNVLVIWATTYLAHKGFFSGWQTFAVISVLIPALNFLTFQAWVFAQRVTS